MNDDEYESYKATLEDKLAIAMGFVLLVGVVEVIVGFIIIAHLIWRWV